MVTSLELVDTAIKIGLGALISGVGAYVIARLNHKKDVEKTRLTRRMDLLESVAETVYKLTQAAISVFATSKTRARFFLEYGEVPEEQETKWDEANAKLNDALSEATTAEAILLLLSEPDCQTLLRNFGEYLVAFYFKTFDPAKYTVSDVDEFKAKILEMRKEFFAKLGYAYMPRA